MHSFRKTFILIAILGWSTFAFAATPPPNPEQTATSKLYESFRIMVQNEKGGDIALSVDKGANWKSVGHVTRPATTVNKKGFPRSVQAKDGAVCETAADRILVKTGINFENDRYRSGRGTVFGLMAYEPSEFQKKSADLSMMHTDIPAGQVIFGKYSPLLGNSFYVVSGGQLARVSPEFTPQQGDIFVIIVENYANQIRDIVFENRYNGTIVANYANGDSLVIGTVLRPVEGIGQFIGTEFLEAGQVRQTHGSAIGISTSPRIGNKVHSLDDFRGGFQIVTDEHIYDAELMSARISSQWMVVGPACGDKKGVLDQQYPLFSQFVTPAMPVEVRIDNGRWESCPEMTGSHDDAFLPEALARSLGRYVQQGLTHIRIINPNAH